MQKFMVMSSSRCKFHILLNKYLFLNTANTELTMQEADKYIESHYEETGIAAVFVNNDSLTLCIESHRYQPKNFW